MVDGLIGQTAGIPGGRDPSPGGKTGESDRPAFLSQQELSEVCVCVFGQVVEVTAGSRV